MSDHPTPSHQRSRPLWLLVPSNAVTTWQLVNIACLGWCALMLYLNGHDYERSSLFEAMGSLTPSVRWWTGITTAITLINLLPILRFWATRVNHTFKTKAVGMTLAATWWGFIGAMFAVGQGLDLGFGIFTILALGSAYEASRLVRGRA